MKTDDHCCHNSEVKKVQSDSLSTEVLAVQMVNEELADGDIKSLLAALSNPCLDIDPELLMPYTSPLYWEEMVADRIDCGHDLTLQVEIYSYAC